MDILIVIALLAWVFIRSAKRNQARKQQEEKNRRAVQQAEQQAPQATQAAPAPTLRPQVRPTVQPRQAASQPPRPHVVQPSRATGHAHTESSMTGFAPCPPATAATQAKGSPAQQRAAAIRPGRTAAPAPQAANAAPRVLMLEPSAQPAFAFDLQQVRNGLIYAEILGKPKALRPTNRR